MNLQCKNSQYFTSVRTYIRPHYYNIKEPTTLTKALKEQRNPFNQLGRKLNNIEPKKVLWTVIGTNVSVYLLWQYSINTYKTFGDDSWLAFMVKNFMSSPANLEQGRIHTLLTSAFSHKSLDHLGINMLVLYTIGQGVMEAVGASRFLLFYAGAGVTASLAAIAYRKYIRPKLEKGYGKPASDDKNFLGSLGASATFLVFFVIPMPAIAVVGLFASYDIYKASTLSNSIIDSAGHIGGAAYGVGYWFLRVKPMLKAGRWRF
ncbi:hypothetical protein INT48_002661 [Thamnidium elegans]|uniref:Peptidase S54 rhomboid domain-containing protein n=1 Tax=Thamnidium elegans TaxID=101142 RepID=A0A8H7SZ61_9FUNG|nr:hypothetical protein INT48_002661 [Thamnidium elegans]